MPKVSVIVPNYNHARFLNQRIDSILNQSFQDFELILLDDCSTDNSRDILSSYANNEHVTHVVYNDKNSGSPFAQWNKGISLAQGEWIWIAESDDWADELFLEVILSAIQQHPSVGLAFAKARTISTSAQNNIPHVTNQNTFYQGKTYLREKLLYANSIYNVSTVLFRKSVVDQIEQTKYDKMRLCGDWFLYSLICEQADVLEVDRLLAYYRVHDSNTSTSSESQGLTFIEGIDVLDNILLKLKVSPFDYSRFWGIRLAEYQIRYDFSQCVMKIILQKYGDNHQMILLFYYLHITKLSFLRQLIKIKRAIVS